MTHLVYLDGADADAVDPLVEARGRWPAEAFAPSADRSVAVAQTRREMLAIGRLRYELFVARDGKAYPHADHDARSFVEPVDCLSLNFWAHDGDDCLAAVRLTRAVDALGAAQISELIDRAGLSAAELRKTVVNSRMVVRDNLRARMRVTELFRLIYRAGLLSGATRCLIGVRPSLSPLYERFGFRPLPGSYRDRVAGEMIAMRLDALDREHLVRINSPYLKVHDEIHRPFHPLEKVSA
jgi:hypothetical protein